MIMKKKKKYYLAVKKLNGLLKEKTGHSGECCLNCLKSFVNELRLVKHKC